MYAVVSPGYYGGSQYGEGVRWVGMCIASILSQPLDKIETNQELQRDTLS